MSTVTTDIFGRRPLEFGGAFAADSAQIDLSLACVDADNNVISSSGLLTQNLQVQYQQPITRLYEVGSQLTYYVAGRPQGTANIARVLGPGSVMAELYACLGNVCRADANDLCFCVQAGCGQTVDDGTYDAMSICLKNVVLQSLGFTIQAQDMVINEQLSLFFTALLARNKTGGCQGNPDWAGVQCSSTCF